MAPYLYGNGETEVQVAATPPHFVLLRWTV